MIGSTLFALSAAMAIGGACGAALVRNLFHAALLLGLCLLGVAGLYLLLEQTWLAAVQVMVYVGGILVLILFATLFSTDILGAAQRPRRTLVAAGVAAAAACTGLAWRLAELALNGAVVPRGTTTAPGAGPDPIEAPSGSIGDVLLGDWLAPLLATGVLLCTALVGAVATVQRFRRPAAVGIGRG